jgi:hypothetical protein
VSGRQIREFGHIFHNLVFGDTISESPGNRVCRANCGVL